MRYSATVFKNFKLVLPTESFIKVGRKHSFACITFIGMGAEYPFVKRELKHCFQVEDLPKCSQFIHLCQILREQYLWHSFNNEVK